MKYNFVALEGKKKKAVIARKGYNTMGNISRKKLKYPETQIKSVLSFSGEIMW